MTPPDFTITTTDTGPDITVAVGGELDMLTAPLLAAALDAALGPARDVAVDLAGVTFIDSIALQALMRAERAVTAAGRSLRLGDRSAVVDRALQLTGLAHHFDRAVPAPIPASASSSGSTEGALRSVLHELSVQLLTERSLRGDLERLARLACDTIAPCRAASIALLVDGRPSTVAVNDHLALELDMAQYAHEEGPCLDALGGQPIRVDVLATDERFAHFAHGVADHHVNSVLSMPVTRNDDVIGTLNLYADAANAFGHDDAHIARIAATQAAHAIARSDIAASSRELRDRLQAAYDEATLAARAEGVLMSLHDCSAEQARQLLANATTASATSLVATAQRVLDAARGDRPPTDRAS
jgi:anti-anti-sigma factor